MNKIHIWFHSFLFTILFFRGRIRSIYSVFGPDTINFKATEQRFYTQNLKKLDKCTNENNPNDTNDLENSEMGKLVINARVLIDRMPIVIEQVGVYDVG